MSHPLKILILAATMLSLTVGLSACQKKVTASASQQARSVTVATVAPHDIAGGLSASGSLIAREDTAVFPQISGYRVAQVLVEEGVWVRAGQPLAQLDDTLLRAQVAQQSALASQASVLAAQAEAQAARVNGSDAASLLSQEQIDGRRFAAKSSRAQAAAQAAAAQDVRTREGMMVVRAPVSGLVISRTVRLGDMAAAAGGTPFYRIAKDGQVELAADLDEQSLANLRPGAPVKVTLADGSEVQGVVRLISPGIDPTTRLGRVRISLPVRPNIRAGGFARATFLGTTQSGLSAPETAVRYDADGAAVLVVGADSKLVRVPVTTGVRGGGFVELLTGPAAGARVVAKASAMLVPGDFVRPVSAP